MKAYISVDMEGIGGITSWKEMHASSPDYNLTRSLATQEANAVVRGLKAAGVNQIVVSDSHAAGGNLLVEELDEDVEVVKGYPRRYYMLHGLDESFQLLLLVGYHAKCGSLHGLLDHSYSSSSIYSLRLNGNEVGEAEVNAGLAAHYGVPTGLVSGDSELTRQVGETFPQGTETVITKYGISRYASRTRHPEKIRAELELKARRAAEKAGDFKLLEYGLPLRVDVGLMDSVMGDVVAFLPSVERKSARDVSFEAENFPVLYRMLMVLIALCQSTKI
jgi:D-amino peptidase